MLNFYQFNDLLDKSLYDDPRVPPPPEYKLASYMDAITSNPSNVNCGDARFSRYERTPIEEFGIMARPNDLPDAPATTDEIPTIWNSNSPWSGKEIKSVVATGRTAGGNLGAPLDDQALKKYTGITW